MTEEQLKELISLQKHVNDDFQKTANFIKAEEFKSLDGLNKDLAITQANAMQALLGILTIRIGLNITAVNDARKEKTEQETRQEEVADGGTQDATSEGDKPE